MRALKGRPEHLPDFREPPLVEVVLGVQFASIAGFRIVHAGLLWQEYRALFPRIVEQPPLNPLFETSSAPGSSDRGFQIELTAGPPVPRLWFLNQDQTQLLQFQPDRLIYNWRKVGSTSAADYPRYETIKVRFVEQYATLQSFLCSQGLESIKPNQCEVTYVNNIHSDQNEDLASSIGRVIRFWTDPPSSGALTPLEDMRFLFRSPLRGEDGSFLGRLTVAVEPAGRQNGVRIIRLTLTARGLPLQDTDEGVFQFFDLGRDRIVRAFTEVTTDEMHIRWGRSK
jgi:uncharacterized protein (TIGR04255 family)